MFGFSKKKLKEPLLSGEAEPARPAAASTSAVRRLTPAEKAQRAIEAAACAADTDLDKPELASCLRASAPCLGVVFSAILSVAPLFAYVYAQAYKLYKVAPKNVLTMAFGAALCFFGGTFVASVAAIEAFRQTGWERVREHVQVVLSEAKLIGAASARDDQKDADGDGVADVDQIAAHELAARKLVVSMRAVTQPERLRSAVGALWGSYLAVLATLRLEFAQTTALALGIVETVRFPLVRVLAPPLGVALAPLQLSHWCSTVIDSAISIVAVVLAWYLAMLVSAFYTALRGGTLFANALCDLIVERGWAPYVEKLPGVATPFDPTTTYFDEAVGYSVAGLGLAFQLTSGFTLPFPLNIILLPLTIVEWLLRWQITFGGAAPPQGELHG